MTAHTERNSLADIHRAAPSDTKTVTSNPKVISKNLWIGPYPGMNVSKRVVDENPGIGPSGEFVEFPEVELVGKAEASKESNAILCFMLMLIQRMKMR